MDLTCYRIAAAVDGELIDSFDDVIAEDGVPHEDYGPIDYDVFTAKIYISQPRPHRPKWASFLLASGLAEGAVANVSTPSALVLIQLRDGGSLFAFTFGFAGRFFLREGVVERNYGLKTVLNLLYPEAAESAPDARVRSVDTKRVADTTVRTRRQTSRISAFEGFDVDTLRDILRHVTGNPPDEASWGTTITGGDSVHLTVDVEFEGLGELCQRLENVARGTDYRRRFPWVDHLRAVVDTAELERAREVVVSALQLGDPAGSMELSPPDLLDWDRVSAFQYHFDTRTGVTRPGIELSHYLAGVDLADITYERLRGRQLLALDGNHSVMQRWSVWRCLTGTFEVDGRHLVLDDGEFYFVAPTFLSQLNADIDNIPTDVLSLPPADVRWDEATYNETACTRQGYLLMDRKLVRGGDFGSGVEVCDALSRDGDLIHVKRHFASKTLSHLFNQGLVVAELLTRHDFREAARGRIVEEDASYGDVIDIEEFRQSEWRVVYGVIGPWRGRPLSEVIPFFSRMTLRYARQELGRIGYEVAFERVETVA